MMYSNYSKRGGNHKLKRKERIEEEELEEGLEEELEEEIERNEIEELADEEQGEKEEEGGWENHDSSIDTLQELTLIPTSSKPFHRDHHSNLHTTRNHKNVKSFQNTRLIGGGGSSSSSSSTSLLFNNKQTKKGKEELDFLLQENNPIASSSTSSSLLIPDLKKAFHYQVGRICKHEEPDLNVSIPPFFIAALAQVVVQELETITTDLEAFAKHRGKITISAEDVKLCARRNSDLYQTLCSFTSSTSNSSSSSSVVSSGTTLKRKT